MWAVLFTTVFVISFSLLFATMRLAKPRCDIYEHPYSARAASQYSNFNRRSALCAEQ